MTKPIKFRENGRLGMADMRWIYGRHTADIRQICGEYTADGRQICGGYAPVRLADIRRTYDILMSRCHGRYGGFQMMTLDDEGGLGW